MAQSNRDFSSVGNSTKGQRGTRIGEKVAYENSLAFWIIESDWKVDFEKGCWRLKGQACLGDI